jgi:HAD superfamily hydrolase (TIGR01509 family)
LKVKAVVFDLGKVLVDFDYSIAGRRLSERSDRPPAEVQALLDHSPLLYSYESAEISSDEFYAAFRERAGYTGSFEQFAACFADIFSEIPVMIRFQEELRQSGVPTYILSNTNEIAIKHIRANFPFFANFTGYVLSYEQRALKPHPPIYRAAEAMAGAHASELLFIDDRDDNVAGAKVLGWQTIQHQDPAVTIPCVRSLL